MDARHECPRAQLHFAWITGMDHVFNGFGCSGKNISPALAWSSAMVGFNLHANALGTAVMTPVFAR
jgi:hypothetical protein